MASYSFQRETRTPHSEVFIIEEDGEEVGRVDLHYSNSTAYATLCVSSELDEDAIQDLIGEIDEKLVMSWEPLRDDFVVTVWAGGEVGVFSETGEDDEDEDEDDEDRASNGNR